MKSIINKLKLFTITVLVMLIATGCQNILQDSPKNQTNGNNAILKIAFGDQARTIKPVSDTKASELTDFKIYYSNVKEELFNDANLIASFADASATSAASIKVCPGIGYVGVTAQKGDLTYSGYSSEVIFYEGENTGVSIVLSLTGFGNKTGDVKITISYTGEETSSDATFVLEDLSDSSKVITGDVSEPIVKDGRTYIEFSKSGVPAGNYRARIQTVVNGTKYVTYSDVVRVASGLLSEGSYDCFAFVNCGLAKTVKITYKDTDGSVLAQKEEYVDGTLYSPKKDNYLLLSWVDKDGNEVKFVPNADAELTAKWVAAVPIHFELNSTSEWSDVKVPVGAFIKPYSYYMNYLFNGVYTSYKYYRENSYASPVKTGYEFDGWYLDKELTVSATDDFIEVTKEPITLYPKWKKTVTIIVKDNTGKVLKKVSTPVGSYIYTEKSRPHSFYTQPTWDSYEESVDADSGKIIAGIYKDQAFTETLETKVQLGEEDIVLYAKYEDNPVTVSFETNCNKKIAPKSFLPDTGIYVNYGSWGDFLYRVGGDSDYITITKSGYSFEGWYLDPEFTKNLSTSSSDPLTLTEDITLYAKWDKAYYIEFETGCKFDIPPLAVKEKELITYGRNIGNYSYFYYRTGDEDYNSWISIENIIIDGKIISGWYFDPEYTEPVSTVFENPTEVIGGAKLYAKWAEPCKVRFITDKGTFIDELYAPENSVFYFESIPLDKISYGITDTCTIRFGSIALFDGFVDNIYKDKELTTPVDIGYFIPITENLTYYVKVVKPATVTLDVNGGFLTTSSKILLQEGAEVNVFSSSIGEQFFDTPIKPGYTFDKWYTDKECTSPINDGDSITVTDGMTLYAGWTPNE